MKHITLITIGLLLLGAVTPALAQDSARIAALEAKVRMLETQNLSLKASVEKISGQSLAELLVGVAMPAAPAPVVETPATAAPSGPNPAKAALIAEMKARIEAAQKVMADEEARASDPFANKSGVKMSKADAEKKRALQVRAIAEMKAQLAALEN